MRRLRSILPGRQVFSSKCAETGVTLVEVLIALFLLSTGIFALISVQSSSWTLAGRSDMLGRAGGLLQRHLQAAEARILNPAADAAPGTETRKVYASGQATLFPGDAAFTVETTTTDLGKGTTSIKVRVSWPGNPTGISETLIAGRQESFRQ